MDSIKSKIETLLFTLGIIAIFGVVLGIFIGGSLYFGMLFVFVLSMYGLIIGKTISLFYILSEGAFARLWGLMYLMFFIFLILLSNGIILDVFKFLPYIIIVVCALSFVEYLLSDS